MTEIINSGNHVSLKAGLIAGFIASAFSGIALLIIEWLALVPQFNFVLIQGSIFDLEERAIASWIVYFAIGAFIWGLLYASAEPTLSGNNSVKKGLVFGVMIWFIVMIFVMPIACAGFFLREYGVAAAGLVFLVDLIFGASLGYFYNKLK